MTWTRGRHFLLTFVRVNPKLKKLQFQTRKRFAHALIIFIIGSISIGGFALPPVL